MRWMRPQHAKGMGDHARCQECTPNAHVVRMGSSGVRALPCMDLDRVRPARSCLAHDGLRFFAMVFSPRRTRLRRDRHRIGKNGPRARPNDHPPRIGCSYDHRHRRNDVEHRRRERSAYHDLACLHGNRGSDAADALGRQDGGFAFARHQPVHGLIHAARSVGVHPRMVGDVARSSPARIRRAPCRIVHPLVSGLRFGTMEHPL